MTVLKEKISRLEAEILRHNSLLVAFSGGIDSALLLKFAFDLLGFRAAGCTAITPSLPKEERISAREVALEIGAPYYTVEYDELAIPGYTANGADRCYLCKSTLFTHLRKIASEKGFAAIAYGANHDDLNEFRPGMRAAEWFDVSAPLLDAGLTKEEIRGLARERGLSIWDKPALACLSSRIPHGNLITHEKISQIEQGESVLRENGFRQARVRHHESVARIEIPREEFSRLFEPGLRDRVVAGLHMIGFRWVTVDLEGYRPGGGLLQPARSGEPETGREEGANTFNLKSLPSDQGNGDKIPGGGKGLVRLKGHR